MASAASRSSQEQVAYLKAFGQACRVQLRSYLEALLGDIESEWGRADPAALPAPARPPAPRSGRGQRGSTSFESNRVAADADEHADEDVVQVVAVRE